MNTDYLVQVLLLMLTAVLIENYIFSKFLGICPFLGVSEKPETALGMGFAVMFVMTLSSAATFAVYHGILVPFGLEYLETIAFILIIAALSGAGYLPAPHHDQLRRTRRGSAQYPERL